MGKSMFIDVRDQSGRIQVYAQKNVLGDEQFDIFRHLDLGDFIGVKGTLFTTKTGEISVKLTSFTILAKSLRPPPAKWHGLEDTEIRYRQRYLDLIGNPEVKDVFLKRSAIVREIRNFLQERGYVEVETPMMQAIPGGAAAQPFKTFHNALGCDFYLRIALELYLKRLLVGGIDKRVRDRPQLPQRRSFAQTQSGVHDARGLSGLRRLRDHDGTGAGIGLPCCSDACWEPCSLSTKMPKAKSVERSI